MRNFNSNGGQGIVSAVLMLSIHDRSTITLPPQLRERVQGLSMNEFQRLCSLAGTALNISFDMDGLKNAIMEACRQTKEQEEQDQLIRLGASQPMMRALYRHYPYERYSSRRRELGLAENGNGGRPRHPSSEEQQRIVMALKKYEKLPLPQQYIAVGSATGVSLSSIWAFLRSGEESDAENDANS